MGRVILALSRIPLLRSLSNKIQRGSSAKDLLPTFSSSSDLSQSISSPLSSELQQSISSSAIFNAHHIFGGQQQLQHQDKTGRRWLLGQVLDPRSSYIRAWNRLFLVSRGLSLAVDPLFLYVLCIDPTTSCLHIDGWFAAMVTILRVAIDVMLIWHVRLQLKLAYVSKKSLVVGRGRLVWDGKKVALHYLQQKDGFMCDVLVMLPIMEILVWLLLPQMITKKAQVIHAMSLVLFIFILQYLPKVSHLVLLMRRMQHVTGYIFGSAWWGFVLNLTAYFIASHVAGACWYLLGVQRIETCLHEQLEVNALSPKWLVCHKGTSFHHHVGDTSSPLRNGTSIASTCLLSNTTLFNYGIYQATIPLALTKNWLERISYPIFWGLMTLSSFGNLSPTNHVAEVAFSIIVITCGLLLFTLLIGNIQMFLYSMTSKKEEMQLKMRDLEHWMRRRQLPSRLRHRVRHYERQRWASTRGVNEEAMVRDLPDGLKRDIKRHLCLDLVRQVPLFGQMDEVVLDSICDRVKPLLFIKDETIMREGDPVRQMLFLVRGHLQSLYRVGKSKTSTFTLGPGNFCGDELLPWCLHNPSSLHNSPLPPSIATITCVDSVEAFGLEAEDLKYVAQHFAHTFSDEKLKHTARYYSPGWRTWAAVSIQLAWKRFKCHRQTKVNVVKSSFARRGSEAALRRDLLRIYAAMISSPKPRDGQLPKRAETFHNTASNLE